jgi:hypothetical protein
MHAARRKFVTEGFGAALAASVICFFAPSLAHSQAGQKPPIPQRPNPAEKDEDAANPTNPFPSPKKALEQNEKDIKKSVEKLFQLASDLKDEVEKTDSVNVLSLAMLKKADEIEHLAHEIKNRAKG